MNEHLQNLARRAGFVGTNFSNTVIGTDQETALANFAELIVQECVDNLFFHGHDDAANQLDWLRKARFGVK